MRCQICKKTQATIHLTEIIDGARSEMHLCEQCAQQEGVTAKSHMPINELLSGLLATQPTDEELFGDDQQQLSCPSCGFTLDQFTKKAVLGCPHDYDVFDKSLSPLIEKAHNGKTTHCGKIPSKTPDDSKKQIELIALRKQLEDAVQKEDYEQAAALRDKINNIEK